jgi:hypothetical protein
LPILDNESFEKSGRTLPSYRSDVLHHQFAVRSIGKIRASASQAVFAPGQAINCPDMTSWSRPVFLAAYKARSARFDQRGAIGCALRRQTCSFQVWGGCATSERFQHELDRVTQVLMQR